MIDIVNYLLYDLEQLMFVGWIWCMIVNGEGLFVVVVCNGVVFDIIEVVLIVVDLFEYFDVLVVVWQVQGEYLGCVEVFVECFMFVDCVGILLILFVLNDFQVIKVCGVMFVVSLIECVIEEQVGGDLVKVCDVCEFIVGVVGFDFLKIKFGFDVVMWFKDELQCWGVWL